MELAILEALQEKGGGQLTFKIYEIGQQTLTQLQISEILPKFATTLQK